MKEKLSNSGIDAVGNISWGTHFCQFYQTKQELMDVVIPYIAAGLENNEFCSWFLPDILTIEEAKKALQKITNINAYLEKGQIEFIAFPDFYPEEDLLKLKETSNSWNKKLEQALDNGYSGLRVVENTSFLEKNSNYPAEGSRDCLHNYEANLDLFVNENNENKIFVLCTYDLNVCSPIEIIELSRMHQFVLAKKQERWELLENSIQGNRTHPLQIEEKLQEKIESKESRQNIKTLENTEKGIHQEYKEIQAQSEKLQAFKKFNEELQLQSEELEAQTEELQQKKKPSSKVKRKFDCLEIIFRKAQFINTLMSWMEASVFFTAAQA